MTSRSGLPLALSYYGSILISENNTCCFESSIPYTQPAMQSVRPQSRLTRIMWRLAREAYWHCPKACALCGDVHPRQAMLDQGWECFICEDCENGGDSSTDEPSGEDSCTDLPNGFIEAPQCNDKNDDDPYECME